MKIGKRFLSLVAFGLLSAALAGPVCIAADTVSNCAGATQNCPAGTSDLAKFEWNGSSYVAEGSANGISVTGGATGGSWTSTDKYVDYVIIKADGLCLLHPTTGSVDVNGNQTESFDNTFAPKPNNGGFFDISYIKFCGTGRTAVTLSSFTVRSNGEGQIVLEWETGTETDNAGFNIYRAAQKGGPYAKINDALIAAQGNSTDGASYRYEDTPPGDGRYYYLLEDVETSGANSIHGPKGARK